MSDVVVIKLPEMDLTLKRYFALYFCHRKVVQIPLRLDLTLAMDHFSVIHMHILLYLMFVYVLMIYVCIYNCAEEVYQTIIKESLNLLHH